jgi:alcohol dehydrogenase YqhD (iron-dependent ADH family)
MLWSSMMALAPLSTAGLGRIHHSLHVLEHGVSAFHNIPHGAGLAALLSGWLSSHLEEFRNPLARWGEKVFGVAGTTDKDKSQATIEALHNLLLLLGCPTRLSDLGLAEGDLDPICAHAAAQLRVRGIPGLDERESLAILKRAL